MSLTQSVSRTCPKTCHFCPPPCLGFSFSVECPSYASCLPSTADHPLPGHHTSVHTYTPAEILFTVWPNATCPLKSFPSSQSELNTTSLTPPYNSVYISPSVLTNHYVWADVKILQNRNHISHPCSPKYLTRNLITAGLLHLFAGLNWMGMWDDEKTLHKTTRSEEKQSITL